MESKAPILLLIFNRPKETQLVFEAVRKSRPARLYIASDGPRENNLEDNVRVLESRSIVSNIDWPCEVKTLYRETNLGCKSAVESAISWFFNHEEEGIILEDDCLPSPDFFVFCDELLERFREDERVWVVTGNNFQDGLKRGGASYYFSQFPHSWGWATWRRCWLAHEPLLNNSLEIIDPSSIAGALPTRRMRNHWGRRFRDLSRSDNKSIWDYPWTATVFKYSGLTATPNSNLVSNIGFGRDSTHTRGVNSHLANIPVAKLGPIRHPDSIIRNNAADEYTFKKVFQGSFLNMTLERVSSIPLVSRLIGSVRGPR